MGKITSNEAIEILTRDNPRERVDSIAMYASCFIDYQEAHANIAEHGALIFHPRTGVPIDNPYLKIKAQAMSQLLKIKIRNVAGLWK
jgi:phage terminase small subunit